MRRRAFLAGSLALLVAPLETDAQQAAKVVTVGVMAPSERRNPIDVAFEQSLQDLGWVNNRNIRIETRYAAGRSDAFAPLAEELVGLGVDVLVVWGVQAAAASKRATSQIPVVFLGAAEPVRFGLVSSLARPGGNLTGVSFDISAEIGTAKHALNLEVRTIEIRATTDLEAAVRRAKEQGAQALYVWSTSPIAWGRQLSELAIAQRLPSIHWFRESAIAGGLLSYASSLTDIAARGAAYVDRILRGAKPARGSGDRVEVRFVPKFVPNLGTL